MVRGLKQTGPAGVVHYNDRVLGRTPTLPWRYHLTGQLSGSKGRPQRDGKSLQMPDRGAQCHPGRCRTRARKSCVPQAKPHLLRVLHDANEAEQGTRRVERGDRERTPVGRHALEAERRI